MKQLMRDLINDRLRQIINVEMREASKEYVAAEEAYLKAKNKMELLHDKRQELEELLDSDDSDC